MTIETPDRLDLHQEGQETTALTLVASEDAVLAAEEVVVRLWNEMTPPDRESARPVRDAVKILLIVHVSQDPGHKHWLTESVRGLLEPRISHQADHWWQERLLHVIALKGDATAVDVVALEEEADLAKKDGRFTGPMSGADFLAALAAEDGLKLDDVLDEAGLARGDV
ncbi:hypothetical protein AB0D08_00230 [Kitasatospora sp. NPDC048540]|uniref:hypothetical protein n=1 Tax=Kitasatospora sp. NPDC048540 TaxID=3155634 RepID=UPI0033EB3D7E